MSYFNHISVQASDSPSVDAFGRWRISNLTSIFDNKNLYDTGSLVWATKTVGNATGSFYTNNAGIILIATGSNSSVIRQTRRRHQYQPGKSQLIVLTGNFRGVAADTIKQMGYFDQNNGIYFMATGSSFGLGLRTNTSGIPVDTFISQSDWNLDRYDGTGPSGRIVNLTASQIFAFDFEWLGAGRIRYGIFQHGEPTYVHEITNINSLNTVYMSTPNLPIRYSLTNSGSAATSMFQICSAVSSEGGLDENGSIRSAAFPAIGTLTAVARYAVLAIRLKSTALDSGVLPLAISSGQTTGGSVYETALLINPSGSINWSWQDLPNSNVQYATSSTNTIAIEGTKIYSAVNAGTTTNNSITYDPTFSLGSDVDGNPDVLVLGWNAANGNCANCAVSMVWREL